MAIVCSICGGTDVKCAAVVDPNTKEFIEFGYEAFLDGECSQCGNVTLTDPNEIKADIDKRWTEYTTRNGSRPNFALCRIVRTDNYDGYEQAHIRIGGSKNVVGDPDTIAVCRDLDKLKTLTDPDPERGFTLVECQAFEFRPVMENRTYRIEIDGECIPVTTEEVLKLYPEQHNLTQNDIERYAATYTALIKSYRGCERWLDAALVRRRLDEEHLMKPGERDSFKMQLHFQWFVRIRKEREKLYTPFRYTVEAFCLDNIQTFTRRYVKLEEALLHCLNGFNENADIPDRYRSVDEYLTKNQKQ